MTTKEDILEVLAYAQLDGYVFVKGCPLCEAGDGEHVHFQDEVAFLTAASDIAPPKED